MSSVLRQVTTVGSAPQVPADAAATFLPKANFSSAPAAPAAAPVAPAAPASRDRSTESALRARASVIGRRLHTFAQVLATTQPPAASSLQAPSIASGVRSFHTQQPLRSVFQSGIGGQRVASAPTSVRTVSSSSSGGSGSGSRRRARRNESEEDTDDVLSKAWWRWYIEAFLYSTPRTKLLIAVIAFILYSLISLLLDFLGFFVYIGGFALLIAMLTPAGRASVIRTMGPLLERYGLSSVSTWLYRATGTIPRHPAPTAQTDPVRHTAKSYEIWGAAYVVFQAAKYMCMSFVTHSKLMARAQQAIAASPRTKDLLRLSGTELIEFNHSYTTPVTPEHARLAPSMATVVSSYEIRVDEREVGTALVFVSDAGQQREFDSSTMLKPEMAVQQKVVGITIEIGTDAHNLGTLADVEESVEEAEARQEEENSVPEAQFVEIKRSDKKNSPQSNK